MPSKSEQQRKWIFVQRDKYKSKDNTPEDMKWIWKAEWEKVKETKLKRYKSFLKENKKYEYFAFRDSEGGAFSKPHKSYLIMDKDTIIQDDGYMKCYKNVLEYTMVRQNKKYKMSLEKRKQICIDPRSKWVFEKGIVQI